MLTRISNGRPGQVVFESDNGNVVSILWAWGSYSDNHITIPDPMTIEERISKQDWESTTVEVYSMGKASNTFTAYLERKYGQNPAGYVPVNDIPKILRRLDHEPRH